MGRWREIKNHENFSKLRHFLKDHSLLTGKEIEVLLEIKKYREEKGTWKSRPRGMYTEVAKRMNLYYPQTRITKGTLVTVNVPYAAYIKETEKQIIQKIVNAYFSLHLISKFNLLPVTLNDIDRLMETNKNEFQNAISHTRNKLSNRVDNTVMDLIHAIFGLDHLNIQTESELFDKKESTKINDPKDYTYLQKLLHKHSIFTEKEIEILIEINKFRNLNEAYQNKKRGIYAGVAKQMELYLPQKEISETAINTKNTPYAAFIKSIEKRIINRIVRAFFSFYLLYRLGLLPVILKEMELMINTNKRDFQNAVFQTRNGLFYIDQKEVIELLQITFSLNILALNDWIQNTPECPEMQTYVKEWTRIDEQNAVKGNT
ncbi:hypothetical protein [uncultured Methanomethylovorans sp.]|uniref:hypothetical protein n=1 Tax=uncultured Methanomethylovorans sp. TaxID=183759 RepID=UPI002AA920F5|nr:hypothetical protein [uncultured Methanomethylovorans sp.]